ncbi:DUF483 domain-containing protein [Candidatus Woesearchaeota archaeon]|nr:DUF483 domain-containing protein [Candidatus Woesearchaeota archaeon]
MPTTIHINYANIIPYMVQPLSHIFGSKTKAQEIVYLLERAKDVVRQGFYEHELPRVEKFCQEKGINLVKSSFKVLLSNEETGNYSNKGIRISEKDKRPGMFFVYLSKDEKKAWMASYYELINNVKDLGLILGYPKCCVNFFCMNFKANQTDLQLRPTNFFTNTSKRDKDLVILSHFPCDSDCSESIALAQRYLDTLMKADRNRARELVDNLKVERPSSENNL